MSLLLLDLTALQDVDFPMYRCSDILQLHLKHKLGSNAAQLP